MNTDYGRTGRYPGEIVLITTEYGPYYKCGENNEAIPYDFLIADESGTLQKPTAKEREQYESH